jgi:hypothetical protein
MSFRKLIMLINISLLNIPYLFQIQYLIMQLFYLIFSKPNQSSLLLSPTTIIGDLLELSDLAAFDPLAQPKSTSPCHISESLRKSPCPQLCFAVPGSSAPNCACAKGVPKGRICEGKKAEIIYLISILVNVKIKYKFYFQNRCFINTEYFRPFSDIPNKY